MKQVLLRGVCAAERALASLCAWIAGSLLVGLALLMTILTLLRAIGSGLAGAEEIGGYLLVSIAYIGLPWAVHSGGMIRVELLYDRVRGRVKRSLTVLTAILGAVISAVITYYSWTLALHSLQIGKESVGMLRLPVAYPQFAMGIGLALLTAQCFLLALIATLTSTGIPGAEAPQEAKSV